MLASKRTQSWLAIIGTPGVCVGTLAYLYLPKVSRLILEPSGTGTATVIQYREASRLTIFSPFRSRMFSFLMALNAILISGSPIGAGNLPLLALSPRGFGLLPGTWRWAVSRGEDDVIETPLDDLSTVIGARCLSFACRSGDAERLEAGLLLALVLSGAAGKSFWKTPAGIIGLRVMGESEGNCDIITGTVVYPRIATRSVLVGQVA